MFASLINNKFDENPKKWRIVSSIAMDTSSAIELCTPFLPGLFLPLAAIANVGKNISFLAASTSRAAINKAFAKCDNLADITGKCGSQSILASMMGTGLGIGIAASIPGANAKTNIKSNEPENFASDISSACSIDGKELNNHDILELTNVMEDNITIFQHGMFSGGCFLLLASVSLWSNYKSLRYVALPSLTREKIQSVFHTYWKDYQSVLYEQYKRYDSRGMFGHVLLTYDLNVNISDHTMLNNYYESLWHHMQQIPILSPTDISAYDTLGVLPTCGFQLDLPLHQCKRHVISTMLFESKIPYAIEIGTRPLLECITSHEQLRELLYLFERSEYVISMYVSHSEVMCENAGNNISLILTMKESALDIDVIKGYIHCCVLQHVLNMRLQNFNTNTPSSVEHAAESLSDAMFMDALEYSFRILYTNPLHSKPNTLSVPGPYTNMCLMNSFISKLISTNVSTKKSLSNVDLGSKDPPDLTADMASSCEDSSGIVNTNNWNSDHIDTLKSMENQWSMESFLLERNRNRIVVDWETEVPK